MKEARISWYLQSFRVRCCNNSINISIIKARGSKKWIKSAIKKYNDILSLVRGNLLGAKWCSHILFITSRWQCGESRLLIFHCFDQLLTMEYKPQFEFTLLHPHLVFPPSHDDNRYSARGNSTNTSYLWFMHKFCGREEREKKRLNHNWTAISDSSSSLIPHSRSRFVCKKTLFIFNVVWRKKKAKMKMNFSKICFISVWMWVCFHFSSLSINRPLIKSMAKLPPLVQ